MVSEAHIHEFAAALRQSFADQRKPAPKHVSARMCCYLVAYSNRFGRAFSLGQVMDVDKLPRALMERFNVQSGKFADRSILSTMLIDCGLMIADEQHRNFELTPRGVALAQLLDLEPTISGAEAL